MLLAIHNVAVYFRLKGGGHLCRGAGKAHGVAACRNFLHRESAALEPGYDFAHVVLAQPEAAAKLLRCQPAVIVRRRAIVLFGKQLVKARLLAR